MGAAQQNDGTRPANLRHRSASQAMSLIRQAIFGSDTRALEGKLAGGDIGQMRRRQRLPTPSSAQKIKELTRIFQPADIEGRTGFDELPDQPLPVAAQSIKCQRKDRGNLLHALLKRKARFDPE